jgi:protein serine kinase H
VECGKLRGLFSVSYTTQWGFTEDYDLGAKLGEGGFGQVWKCEHRETKNPYAVKVIPAITIKDVERYERELKVFERLSNPHVVHLHEIFRNAHHIYLVMDLCLGGDLMDYILRYWSDPQYPERAEAVASLPACALGLPWKEAAMHIWQMLAGLAYMHHHRFCHRDIKLENYMLKEPGPRPHLQLCDFGLSIRLEKGQKAEGRVGTLMYMAPEVVKSVPYDQKCDIWGVGVCAYIITTMCSPWGQADKEEMSERIKENARDPWPYPENKPKEMRDLVDSMMTLTPSLRNSVKDTFKNCKWLMKHGAEKTSSECTIA